jgi:SAM-dependent methyltransferase
VVGLDIVPAAVEEFRRRFGARDDMKIVQGDLFSEPPAPELAALAPFDAVVSCNVLEHLEDDVAALERMGSLLKPGGRLGLFVPGGGERLYGTLDALDRHYRRYTPARLAERLEQARMLLGATVSTLSPGVGEEGTFQTLTTSEAVISIVQRHPMTLSQIQAVLHGRPQEDVRRAVEDLRGSGRVATVERFGQSFLVVAEARFS